MCQPQGTLSVDMAWDAGGTWVGYMPVPVLSFCSYGDFQAYGRMRKNRTYICKPDSGCQGRGIFITRNPKEIKHGEHMICQQYITKVGPGAWGPTAVQPWDREQEPQTVENVISATGPWGYNQSSGNCSFPSVSHPLFAALPH